MALVVGLDLGRKSAHDAAIYRRETGRQVNRGFRFLSTCEGFDTLFERVRQVREPGEEVAFVIDSPGRAWIPVAAVIKNHGFDVYRPMATLVVSIRRGTNRKNKTNRIDAKALAKCLLNHPEEVNKVFLPSGSQAKLDQTVRRRDRLVDAIRRRKQRIQDFTEAINPRLMVAMGDFALTLAGRAFLASYLDPRRVVKLGRKRLWRFLEKHYTLSVKPERVDDIFDACADAVVLYDPIRAADQMPFDDAMLQDEMVTELQRLQQDEKLVRDLEKRIAGLNQQLDPGDSLISLPGIRHILAGGVRSSVGHIDRFKSLTDHRGFAGLYPSSKGTGDHRAKGTNISKMSSSRYKRVLYMAADNAYKWDLEMAAFYHKRRRAGHTHTQAVCAVANGKLLPRIHNMLKAIEQIRGTNKEVPRYVYRDLSGNPISKQEARTIIKATWGDVEYN